MDNKVSKEEHDQQKDEIYQYSLVFYQDFYNIVKGTNVKVSF